MTKYSFIQFALFSKPNAIYEVGKGCRRHEISFYLSNFWSNFLICEGSSVWVLGTKRPPLSLESLERVTITLFPFHPVVSTFLYHLCSSVFGNQTYYSKPSWGRFWLLWVMYLLHRYFVMWRGALPCLSLFISCWIHLTPYLPSQR